MPGKGKNTVKNRPSRQSFAESLVTANKATNDDYPSSASTCSSSKTNPIRSRSPLINSDERKNHSNTNIKFTLTKTTDGQAGNTSTTLTPLNKASLSQQVPTKTATGQADNAAAATLGDDELIVTNDVSFPEDMETDAKKSYKRKRETVTATSPPKANLPPPLTITASAPTQKSSPSPISRQHEGGASTSTSTSAKSGEWIPVKSAPETNSPSKYLETTRTISETNYPRNNMTSNNNYHDNNHLNNSRTTPTPTLSGTLPTPHPICRGASWS